MTALQRSRRTASCLALVALLLLSGVPAPAAAAGTAPLTVGETYCIGTTLTFAADEDYELYRVSETETADNETTYEDPEFVEDLDLDDGRIRVHTRGLEADHYMVVRASRADDGKVENDGVIVREGVVRGTGGAGTAGFDLESCPAEASFDGGSQTVRHGETARYALQLDFPADDRVYLRADGVDNETLASFVAGARVVSEPNSDVDDWVRVDVPDDGDLEVAVPFESACGNVGGSFRVVVAGADSGDRAIARTFVRAEGVDDYAFARSSYVARQGTAAGIDVAVRGCGNDVQVRVERDDPAISLRVDATDRDGDGVVQIRFETDRVLADGADAVVAAGTDRVTSVDVDADDDLDRLPAGNYALELRSDGEYRDNAVLFLGAETTTTTTSTTTTTATTATTTTTTTTATTATTTTTDTPTPTTTTGPGFGPALAVLALVAAALFAVRRS